MWALHDPVKVTHKTGHHTLALHFSSLSSEDLDPNRNQTESYPHQLICKRYRVGVFWSGWLRNGKENWESCDLARLCSETLGTTLRLINPKSGVTIGAKCSLFCLFPLSLQRDLLGFLSHCVEWEAKAMLNSSQPFSNPYSGQIGASLYK